MNDVDNRGPAVVVSGTVIGGFEFHGPFPTISAAHEWYEQQFFGGFLKMPASIVLLAAPRPATTDLDAAPAATASEAENQAVGRRAETSAGEAGTGDTRASDSAIVEAAAEVAYAAMLFDRKSINGRPGAPLVPPPPWVPRGNSLAQDAARDAARKILAMVPPAADAKSDAGECLPGGGFRWVKPGEALQAGDEIKQVRMSGTRWLACAPVGRVISEGESYIWRRRITTDHDAAPAATASEAENQAVGRRAETSAGEAGTGDTQAAQEPVAWAAYESESDAEPISLCFKESRARDEVRGVAGSRVVPLYAAPPADGPTLTDAERWAVRECADIARSQLWNAREGGDEETIARWMQRLARITGLLARAAVVATKEVRDASVCP